MPASTKARVSSVNTRVVRVTAMAPRYAGPGTTECSGLASPERRSAPKTSGRACQPPQRRTRAGARVARHSWHRRRSTRASDDTVTSSCPVWFGDEERPAFGWFHSPEHGLARGGAVICPPLGFDYIHGHYALRLLAERLAAGGFCVLRFDYDGTGDSAGGTGDPGRLDAWTATVRRAISLVRETGVNEVCAVGMRLGAGLAAEAVATDSQIDQLVLWDPCSGRSFLRERAGYKHHHPRKLRGLLRRLGGDSGHRLRRDTAREIEGISIEKCPLPLARRVLVLTRTDRPPNRPLLSALPWPARSSRTKRPWARPSSWTGTRLSKSCRTRR